METKPEARELPAENQPLDRLVMDVSNLEDFRAKCLEYAGIDVMTDDGSYKALKQVLTELSAWYASVPKNQ